MPGIPGLRRPKKREFELPPRQDVLVRAPVAVAGAKAPRPVEDGQEPPWKDLYIDEARRARGLETEKSELIDFARQVSSLCLSLAKMHQDAGHPSFSVDTVTIPKELHEQWVGASISVGTDADGNPFVKLRERGTARITPAE